MTHPQRPPASNLFRNWAKGEVVEACMLSHEGQK